MQIAEAAGNPYLTVMVESVRELMQDIVGLIADHPGSIDEAMRHHRSIITAIAERDPTRAAAEMDAHVSYTAGVVQHQADMSKQPTSNADQRAAKLSTDRWLTEEEPAIDRNVFQAGRRKLSASR